MRRFKQQLPDDEARRILARATHGVLSLVDVDGGPYGVPMSFVYDGAQTIYFHGAREGRKTDCVRHAGRASFCVVAMDEIHPEEFTTYYRSVVAEGRIGVVTEREQTIGALRMLGAKYSPGLDSTHETESNLDRVSVFRFEIETVSGKEAIELTRRR